MAGLQRAQEKITWKIGRYDAVCQLATGGMAEILLARLRGPSGFQRPVAIKRILPHLAQNKDFVTMFLDEARIIAGIRHPNVVHVHELAHEGDDELFLVMEYMEGESVSVLIPRLRKNEEKLPYPLVAYIVAEACAGLHAAHELADESGKQLNVVHRDVSPQNIFVGYSGEVKVLDFGIATAADRVTRTETGQFKGKFEYSSPEQCVGLALDRRSDIFSLGILLYELSTLTRLFKRNGHMPTLRAICEAPIVPPVDIVPDFPKALSDVAMRALDRRPNGRYQTALEMRRELLTVMTTLSHEVAPEETLGKKMRELFPDRIEEKAAMLRGAQAGEPVHGVPTEIDIDIEVPIAFDDPPDDPEARLSGLQARAQTDIASDAISGRIETENRRSRVSLILLFAAVSVIGVLAIVAGMDRSSKKIDASPSVSAALLPEVVASANETAAPSAALSASASPSVVAIHVETSPPNAHILLGLTDRGTAPVDLQIDRGDAPLKIQVRHDGFRTLEQTIVPNVDQKLVLTLVALPATTKHPAEKPAASSPYRRFD
jgi:eukaryotic-like serine/threonine-protein kinase